MTIPSAITIAGSDSGGGAGIQADLKTFAAIGVHGTCAITCITAQNPDGVNGIETCTPRHIGKQMTSVIEGFHPRAVKTGMLYSAEIIREVANVLKKTGMKNLVVDPVMVATSGAALLKPKAFEMMAKRLFTMAALITPNLDEAALITGVRLESVEDMRDAAKWMQQRYGASILLKGGHLKQTREAVDVLRIGSDEWILTAPYIRGVRTHGTGCTYSAAITAHLAQGLNIEKSVFVAKEFITNAIANSHEVNGNQVLDVMWKRL